MNGSIGEWFRTTVGVRQGCLLSPTLLNIFLERIKSDALEEHDGKVSIGGRNITNLRFANNIDALAEEEQKLEALVEPAQGLRWRSVRRRPNWWQTAPTASRKRDKGNKLIRWIYIPRQSSSGLFKIHFKFHKILFTCYWVMAYLWIIKSRAINHWQLILYEHWHVITIQNCWVLWIPFIGYFVMTQFTDFSSFQGQ